MTKEQIRQALIDLAFDIEKDESDNKDLITFFHDTYLTINEAILYADAHGVRLRQKMNHGKTALFCKRTKAVFKSSI